MILGQTLDGTGDIVEAESENLIDASLLSSPVVPDHTDTEKCHRRHGQQDDQNKKENKTSTREPANHHRP